ncbi:MAG TPA: ABC transporter ATP-binding protein [Bacteroidetes bacterium]|nr:ABC transporter ATP-binding protein [Bacteroidota bacterium]
MSGKGTMIRLDGFEKWYGKLQAVKPLDLSIRRGETFALLGPNGGGKSTVIRALVGLHAPTKGTILVDGLDAARFSTRVREHLSYMPQRVTMPDMLTAREVVTLFAKLKGAASGRVEEVLELFALTASADRYAREFSGGMLQRLGLAVAFLKEVPLFILDEPTLNLDPLGIERLRDMVRELKGKGVTLVFSSHILQDAIQLADRVGILVNGELVKLESVPDFQGLIARETVVRVVLSTSSEEIVAAAREAGGAVAGANGRHLSFRAEPKRRLEIIRAIETAGGVIEEFHTDPPDWEALVRKTYDSPGGSSWLS